MKYIKTSRNEFIIFSKGITHSDMASGLRRGSAKIASAGFVNNNLECYGKSISLGISSDEKDTELLKRQFDY